MHFYEELVSYLSGSCLLQDSFNAPNLYGGGDHSWSISFYVFCAAPDFVMFCHSSLCWYLIKESLSLLNCYLWKLFLCY